MWQLGFVAFWWFAACGAGLDGDRPGAWLTFRGCSALITGLAKVCSYKSKCSENLGGEMNALSPSLHFKTYFKSI